MRALSRAFDLMLAACGALAALLVAGVAVGMSIDVIQRNSGFRTISWMYEACEYGIFAATFIGAPWVLRQGAHVSVDVFVSIMPPAARRILRIAADVIGFATCAALLYYAIAVARGSIRDDARLIKMFIIPEWWVFGIIALSILLLLIEFARRIAVGLRMAEPPAPGRAPTL